MYLEKCFKNFNLVLQNIQTYRFLNYAGAPRYRIQQQEAGVLSQPRVQTDLLRAQRTFHQQRIRSDGMYNTHSYTSILILIQLNKT